MNKVLTFNEIYDRESDKIRQLLDFETLPTFAKEFIDCHPEQDSEIDTQFEKWKGNALRWIADPTNGAYAFLFVDGHPSMWSFENFETPNLYSEQIPSREEFNEYLKGSRLITSGHLASAFKCFSTGDDETILVETEIGTANTSPFRAVHFHDYIMDAYGSTLEECYVINAKHLFGLYGFGVTRYADYMDDSDEFFTPVSETFEEDNSWSIDSLH